MAVRVDVNPALGMYRCEPAGGSVASERIRSRAAPGG